ncbi:hypothetical protein [Cohnella sp. WQ 127256]|uniref:hypothetical protein n=1 Tax=Cohnella sp. WQ 127256 TaxID=2938790 RepID=UPI0021179626|nr:hypothetical protein [Cohnella sp. WQ 127256]
MIKHGILAQAQLNVTFTLLVKAKRRTHALGMADFQLNNENIILDRIQLVNEQGFIQTPKVERIDPIQWITVHSTDYSNLFKVVGQIRLVLSMDRNVEHHVDSLWTRAYKFPRSMIQDRTNWVIPTTHEPAFTQVLSQTLEFNSGARDSKLITEVG